MKNIKLVEYRDKYAEAVAEMWRNSITGWNGESFLTTAKDVIDDEKNSIHLKAWIALDDDKVLGYCNLYEYQEDTGALYIGLLNVRDDHHGKKIGKKLVLKAVEKTIELGWDRLDLYTWPGNTKAVPLYKKCGFFWEDRDDTTHMMNFIPIVMKNELVKDYFNEIDWYSNSIRPIEVSPDGCDENGFDYLTYLWKKDGKNLKMEFARRGRGLRLIETDEFMIKATVEYLKLVFGAEYSVKYGFINKTDHPIHIEIKGLSDEKVEFNFETAFDLIGKKTIDAKFKVNTIKKEQSKWKTHPGVVAEVYVNGKKSEFRVGIEPKFPLKTEIHHEEKIYPKNVEQVLYIDLENGFNEKVLYEFELPETSDINFSKRNYKIELDASEKKSFPCCFSLNKACVYSSILEISVTKADGSQFTFINEFGSVFYTQTDMFWGKTKTHYWAGNGIYSFAIQHIDFVNIIDFKRIGSEQANVHFAYPQFKQPIQDEFNKKRFDSIQFKEQGAALKVELSFTSEKARGFSFIEHIKLWNNGLLERWFEFRNNSNTILEFNDLFRLYTEELVAPIDGNVIKLKQEENCGTGNFDANKLTENWFFVNHPLSKIGVMWNDDTKLSFGDWKRVFEYEIFNSQNILKQITKPVQFSLGFYNKWQELRYFATGKESTSEILVDSLEISVNNSNPFIKDEIPIKILDHRKDQVHTKIEISNKSKKLESTKVELNVEDEYRLKDVCVKSSNQEIEIINIQIQEEEVTKEIKKTVFPIGSGLVNKNKAKIENIEIFEVSNGLISLKSAKDFGPVLFSMKYENTEWLDTDFPKRTCKSWWNPWTGGIGIIPDDISMKAILEEINTTEFIEMKDQIGNQWVGIKISTQYQKTERFKGLGIHQYFLILPGVPVVLNLVEVEQNSGKYVKNLLVESECYFKFKPEISDCGFEIINEDQHEVFIKSGFRQYERIVKSPIVFKGDDSNMTIAYDNMVIDNMQYADREVLVSWIGEKVNCENSKRKLLGSKFFIFGNEKLTQSMIIDLFKLKFEKQR
ncbi:MAG: GNAT family N-acetyltransferase [Candidatus Cloacimonetes bacterium]|nr:GNAT family N-acetyltransferase [Candidatus Cloacimonadota bacterium]